MEFVGVVLAGGQSSRMGKDKSQLVRQQQTMLEFTKQQLESAGAKQVLVSSQFGAQKGIPDHYNNLGPLAGIYSVLSQLPIGQWCLFCPVDLPFLSAAALSELIKEGGKHNCASHFHQQPLPLLLQANNNNLEVLKDLLDQASKLSIRHFLSLIEHQVLPPKPDHDWFNANSPEQWQQALAKIN